MEWSKILLHSLLKWKKNPFHFISYDHSTKVKQRFQDLEYYERVEKSKKKIHKTLNKNRHKKTKFISRLRKKV